MKKVVQIQFSNESAARSALRLQNEFQKRDIQSSIVSLKSSNARFADVRYLQKSQWWISRLDEKIQMSLLKKVKKEFGLFSFPVLGSDISSLPEVQEADIIYIHWALSGFLNFSSLRKLASLKKPLVFIMHDMWSITGGCHYSFTCDKYLSSCKDCQMFSGSGLMDLAARGFNKKVQFYSNFDNLFFVSPSMWLYECAKKADLTKSKSVFYIPNVIDISLFKPFDKLMARKMLNVNKSKFVIAFGAVSVDSPYKGWSYLQKALEHLYSDNSFKDIEILVFGSGYNKQIAEDVPYQIKFMGYLADEYSTMVVYNAADVFVVPSLADNQPTTVQESLCCGTPVVGFDTGGIPDMIRHKENGYLARYRDAEDLSQGIKYCLQNKLSGYMLDQFDPALTVNKHLELYDFAIKPVEEREKFSPSLSIS